MKIDLIIMPVLLKWKIYNIRFIINDIDESLTMNIKACKELFKTKSSCILNYNTYSGLIRNEVIGFLTDKAEFNYYIAKDFNLKDKQITKEQLFHLINE